MSKYYVGTPDGTREGPFDEQAINQRITSGIYKPGCLVWQKGMKEWEPIESHFLMKIEPVRKKKSSIGISLLLLVLLSAGGVGGYKYYQHYDETHLSEEEARKKLMECNISANKYNEELIYRAGDGRGKASIEAILLVGNVTQEAKDQAMESAMERGWKENCEVLLKYGASLSKALEIASRKRFQHQDIKNMLREKTFEKAKGGTLDGDSVVVATERFETEEFQKLIEAGIDVNRADSKSGITPLMQACMDSDHKEKAAYLILKGAGLNIRDKSGHTALWYACRESAEGGNMGDHINLLIQHKADVNATNDKGISCLMVLLQSYASATEARLNQLELLIAAGADVNATIKDTEHGDCVLSIANGNTKAMQLLAEHGAVNTTDARLHTYDHQENKADE